MSCCFLRSEFSIKTYSRKFNTLETRVENGLQVLWDRQDGSHRERMPLIRQMEALFKLTFKE